eukprot:g407.t1
MAGVDNSVLFSTLDDNLQDQLRTIAAKGWRNTNFRDNHTLLHWACFHNRIDVLHLLLESSFRDEIDLHVRDRAGHKAIDYATRPEIRRYMDNALKAQNARKKFRTLGAGVGPGVPPGGPGSGAGVQPLRASPDDGFEAPLTITRRTERGSSSGGVENDKLLDLTKMDLVEEESSGTSWLSKISGGFFGGSAAGTASNSSTSAGEDSLSSEPSISSTGTGYLSGFFGGGSNPATSPFQQQLATVNEDGEVPMYDMLGRPRGPRTSSTASPPIKKAPSTSISASAGAGRLSGSSPPKMKCRMPDCQECPAGKPLPDTGVCLDVCCAPASGPSGGGSAAAGGSLSTQLRNPSSRLKGSSLGKPAFLGEDLTLASHRGDAWVNPRAPLRSERGQNGRTKYEEDGDLIHDQSSGQNLLDLLGTLDPNHKKGSSRGDPTPSRGGSGSYGTVDLATGGNRAASGNHDRFRAMKEAAERDDELDKLNQKRKDEDNDSPWDSDDEDAAFKRAKKKISRKKKKRGDACCYCPTPWGGDVPLTCCGCLCCSVLLCGFLTVLFLCGFYTATAILDLLMPDAPAQAPAYATAANGVPILQNGQPIVMQSNGVALSLAAASGQQQQRQWVVPPQQPPPSQGAQQGTQPQGSYPGQGMMGNGQVPLMPGMVQPQQGRSGFSLSEAIVNMFEGLLPSWLKHGRSSNAVSEVSQQQPSGGVQSRQEVLASGPVPTPTAAPQTASAIDGSLPPSVTRRNIAIHKYHYILNFKKGAYLKRIPIYYGPISMRPATQNDKRRALVRDYTRTPRIKVFKRQRHKVNHDFAKMDPRASGSAPKERTFGDPADPYVLLEELGGGMQARVFKCRKQSDVNTETPYAVKVVEHRRVLNETERETQVAHLLQEAQILQNLHHPKIVLWIFSLVLELIVIVKNVGVVMDRWIEYGRQSVNLIETLRDDEHVYLVMEYVSNGDLFDKIAERKGLAEVEAKYVFQQLIEAIAYMHDAHVIHRDLKPENILVGKEVSVKENGKLTTYFDVKVADFGLSKLVTEDSVAKTHVGTPYYWAPELLKASNMNYGGAGGGQAQAKLENEREEKRIQAEKAAKAEKERLEKQRKEKVIRYEKGSNTLGDPDNTKTDFAVISTDGTPGDVEGHLLQNGGAAGGDNVEENPNEANPNEQEGGGEGERSPAVPGAAAGATDNSPSKRTAMRTGYTSHPQQPANYDERVDLWSLGVVLYVILMGHYPFNKKRATPLHDQIMQGLSLNKLQTDKKTKHLSPDVQNLIAALLTADPELRLKLDDIFVHPWCVTGYFSAKRQHPIQGHVLGPVRLANVGLERIAEGAEDDDHEFMDADDAGRGENTEEERTGQSKPGGGGTPAVARKVAAGGTTTAGGVMQNNWVGGAGAAAPAGGAATTTRGSKPVSPVSTNSSATPTLMPIEKPSTSTVVGVTPDAGEKEMKEPTTTSTPRIEDDSKNKAVDDQDHPTNKEKAESYVPVLDNPPAAAPSASNLEVGPHPAHSLVATNLWATTPAPINQALVPAGKGLIPGSPSGMVAAGHHVMHQQQIYPVHTNFRATGDHLFQELLQLQVTIAKCLESAYLAYRGAEMTAAGGATRSRRSSRPDVVVSGVESSDKALRAHMVAAAAGGRTGEADLGAAPNKSAAKTRTTTATTAAASTAATAASSSTTENLKKAQEATSSSSDGRDLLLDEVDERQMMLRKLRDLSHKCYQVTAQKAFECVTQYGATARRVRQDVLPDMQLAIEEDAPELAQAFLETINGWVTNMKTKGGEMEDAYREISDDIRSLIDNTSVIKKAVDADIRLANQSIFGGGGLDGQHPISGGGPHHGNTPSGGGMMLPRSISNTAASCGSAPGSASGHVMNVGGRSGENSRGDSPVIEPVVEPVRPLQPVPVAARGAADQISPKMEDAAVVQHQQDKEIYRDLYAKIHQIVAGPSGGGGAPGVDAGSAFHYRQDMADIDAQMIDLLFFTPNFTPQSGGVQQPGTLGSSHFESASEEEHVSGRATIEEIKSSVGGAGAGAPGGSGSGPQASVTTLGGGKRSESSNNLLQQVVEDSCTALSGACQKQNSQGGGNKTSKSATTTPRSAVEAGAGVVEKEKQVGSSSSREHDQRAAEVQQLEGPGSSNFCEDRQLALIRLPAPNHMNMAANCTPAVASSAHQIANAQYGAQRIRHQSAIALMRAISALRKVDEVLQRSTMFWSHLGLTTGQVAQMKDTLTLWIKHASTNEKLRMRLNERLEQYRQFWAEFETCSVLYCEELREGCNRMFSFLLQMETRADCLDTVKNMIS